MNIFTKKIKQQTINKLILRILPLFFLLILFSSTCASLLHYILRDTWAIGDWLINYQGGFVRRGLIGEFFFIISNYTNINLGILVTSTHIILYGIILFI